MHRQNRPSPRADEQRVAEVDINFGHEKGGENARQFDGAFLHFNKENRTFAVGDALGLKDARDAIRIVDDDASDRGFRSIHDAQGQDDDVIFLEEFDDFEESTDFVFKEDGKLADFRTRDFFSGGESGHADYL